MEMILRIDRNMIDQFDKFILNGDHHIDIIYRKTTEHNNVEIKIMVETYDDYVWVGKFYFG